MFTFWRPLTVNTTLRFNILDAVYSHFPLITDLDFCLNVQLFGCLVSQANYSISKINCEHTRKATAVTPSTTTHYHHKPTAFLTVHELPLSTSNHLLQSTSSSDVQQSCCSSSSSVIATLSPTVPTLASINEPTNPSHLWVIVSVAVLLLAVMLLVVGMVAGVVVWSAVRKKKTEINDHNYFIVENETSW